MVENAGGLERLRELGVVICLDAPLDVVARRVLGDPTRPMLATDGDPFERLAELWHRRRAAYDRIGPHLDTSRRRVDETASDIAAIARARGREVRLRVDTRPVPGAPDDADHARLTRILIERGVRRRAGDVVAALGDVRRAVVFAPDSVARLALAPLAASLDARGIAWRHVALDDGDAAKTIDQAARLLEALAEARATRDTVVITVGGGVTSDLGGFVAATYMRGLPLVHVPTTLLAQVDAAIGGKVGVNTRQAKNLVGAWHHPHAVLADVDVLATLPPRELACGWAEAIKTAWVGDANLWERMLERAESGASPGDVDVLDETVLACARIKADVVEEDPYERDRRRVLNFGHTLGHALEAACGYGAMRHGEAVAVGMVTAMRLGVERGVLDAEHLDALRRLLAWAGLPDRAPAVDADALRRAMAHDKKHRAARLRFVLPRRPGRVDIVDDVTVDDVIAAMPASATTHRRAAGKDTR